MSNITEKVLREIKEKNVNPIPAWRFVFERIAVWCGFVFLVILGSHSVSVIIYLLSDHDWSGLGYYRGGVFGYLFSVIPYLWFVILILLVVAAYGDFRKTKDGYRYGAFWVVGGVIALSIFLGGGLYAMGIGGFTDELLAEKMPQYRKMVISGRHMWNRPHDGYLAGKVIVAEKDYVLILSVDRNEWRIIPVSREAQAFVEKARVNHLIRCVGQEMPDKTFNANVIMPWQPKNNGYRLNGIMNPLEAYKQGEGSMRPPVHPVVSGTHLNY